jgi:hypothetical protein
LEGVQGKGGALGGAKSLALHFGELSKVNGRVKGGVRGGVVLMQLMSARLVGPMLANGHHLAVVARRGQPRHGDDGAIQTQRCLLTALLCPLDLLNHLFFAKTLLMKIVELQVDYNVVYWSSSWFYLD